MFKISMAHLTTFYNLYTAQGIRFKCFCRGFGCLACALFVFCHNLFTRRYLDHLHVFSLKCPQYTWLGFLKTCKFRDKWLSLKFQLQCRQISRNYLFISYLNYYFFNYFFNECSVMGKLQISLHQTLSPCSKGD